MHKSLQQFQSLFETTQVAATDYYVLYHNETGMVSGVQVEHPNIDNFIKVPSDNKLLKQILSSTDSELNFIVAYDNSTKTKQLFKKDNLLRSLEVRIPKLEALPYGNTNAVTKLMFNLSKKILTISVDNVIFDNLLQALPFQKIQADQEYITFFIVDKLDPNKIYDTIQCNLNELLNHTSQFSVPWVTEENLNQLVIWTLTYFDSYSWEWIRTQIVSPALSGYTYSINTAAQTDSDEAHIRLHFSDNGVTITNNLKEALDEPIAVHLIKHNDPSYYFGTFAIDSTATEPVILDYIKPYDNMDLIYNNTKVKINWTKE